MKIKQFIIVVGIFFLFLSACGTKNTASETPENHTGSETASNPTATSIPDPDSGKATVTGIVISATGQPLPVTPVWLAEVVRQDGKGVYVLDSVSSPGIYSDENSTFVISNITPGEYVIVVGDPEGRYEIINDSSGKAKVWDFPPDQVFDVGDLQVQLSQ